MPSLRMGPLVAGCPEESLGAGNISESEAEAEDEDCICESPSWSGAIDELGHVEEMIGWRTCHGDTLKVRLDPRSFYCLWPNGLLMLRAAPGASWSSPDEINAGR